MPYRIWCEVSGGPTGHRASWLKVQGQIQEYKTREEAAAIAANLIRLNAGRNAHFYYEPKEV